MSVIRPLAYVREATSRPTRRRSVPDHSLQPVRIADNLQRKQVKKMLEQWNANRRADRDHGARAGRHPPSQLSDPKLFDFLALGRRGDDALPDAHAWLAGGETATRRH